MSVLKRGLILLIAIILIGCSEGYHFSDEVTFYAPKSYIEVHISSKGFVPQGNDLGDGKGIAFLTFKENYTDTLQLLTSPENIDTIIYQRNKIPFKCSQMNKIAFFNFLDSLGFNGLDKNEIIELRDAITLINYGPKAGFKDLKIQTASVMEKPIGNFPVFLLTGRK